MITEIILPMMGETMNEGTIVEWMKGEGDAVQKGDVLFSIESDKATLEVESTASGYIRKIFVPAAKVVPVLSVVAIITKSADEDISSYTPKGVAIESTKAEAPAKDETATAVESSGIDSTDRLFSSRLFSSPRARKLAREEGISLYEVSGSGPEGRVVERDVQAYLASAPKVTPLARSFAEQEGVALRKVTGTGHGGKIVRSDVHAHLNRSEACRAKVCSTMTSIMTESTRPMSGVRAVIARRMFEGHSTTAPVTLTMEADATSFVNLRERIKADTAEALGFNIGYNDLLIKLVTFALERFPYMNARLDEAAGLIRNLSEVNMALAVETDRGLLVPVVKDVASKSLVEVATELREVIEKARSGKAMPDELKGSTFTITNLGAYDVDAFTPIINMPETAILGVGRIKEQPVVFNGGICARKMMWLSLTFDHRLVDGAPAASFLKYVKDLIEDPFLWLAAYL